MQKDYSQFTIDDFLADEYFQRWAKYPDVENNAFWEKWLSEHPEKRDAVMKASLFISHLHFNSKLPDRRAVELSLNKNLERIQSGRAEAFENKRKGKVLWVTSSLVLLLFVYTAYHSFFEEPLAKKLVSTGVAIRTLLLPDSSLVTLNAHSSIKYSPDLHIADTREIWLDGEAFFIVKHRKNENEPSPLIVHSGALNVEAVGTTFNVKRRGDVSNVTLNDGHIRIHIEGEEGSTIYLEAGDFFQYSKKEKFIRKKKVNPELYSDWREQKLKLHNVPLSEVSQFIQDIYGLKVVVEDEQLASKKLSGTLHVKNEKELLHTLAFTFNLHIEKKDSVVTFQKKTKTD